MVRGERHFLFVDHLLHPLQSHVGYEVKLGIVRLELIPGLPYGLNQHFWLLEVGVLQVIYFEQAIAINFLRFGEALMEHIALRAEVHLHSSIFFVFWLTASSERLVEFVLRNDHILTCTHPMPERAGAAIDWAIAV